MQITRSESGSVRKVSGNLKKSESQQKSFHYKHSHHPFRNGLTTVYNTRTPSPAQSTSDLFLFFLKESSLTVAAALSRFGCMTARAISSWHTSTPSLFMTRHSGRWGGRWKMRIKTRAERNIWLLARCTNARCRKTCRQVQASLVLCKTLSRLRDLRKVRKPPQQWIHFLPSSISWLPPPCHLFFSPSSHPLNLRIPSLFFRAHPWPSRSSLSLFLSCQLLPLWSFPLTPEARYQLIEHTVAQEEESLQQLYLLLHKSKAYK